MQTEKLSIIIPCYNDAEYIEQSVQSALDQTYINKEIIVVDDGSNEETKAILENLKHKITLLITQENKGPSAARNEGIAAAEGEFILVLDSDDFFEPEFGKMAIEIFLNSSDVKIVTCYTKWFDEKSHKIFKPRGGFLENILFNNNAMGSSMFKKTEWRNIGGYDVRMKGFEDWEFYIRLLKNGGRTEVIPKVLFHYRKKKQSRNTLANEKKFELLKYIYLKHAVLYKENFELFTEHLLGKIKVEESEKIKNSKRVEYRLGKSILWPIRKLKIFFKNK